MKNISEEIKKIFESKVAFRVLCAIGVVIVALLIFSAGVTVGFHRASFGRAWGENYEHNFGMRPDAPLLGMSNFPNADGAIGKILKINLPTIIVQDKDGTEKVIVLTADTKIQKVQNQITPSDLQVDDFLIVIGSPNTQGQIEAKFIRVLPIGLPAPGTQAPVQAN